MFEKCSQLMTVSYDRYKNFRCVTHDKFFELNIYEKNPSSAHHWRADIARPAGHIDL